MASRFEAKRGHGLVPLVGRDETSMHVANCWARAKAGQGQVVLLFGEAGIGKSHLTAAFLETIEEESHRRLRYFCAPQYAESPLHPVIAHLERAVGFADAQSVEDRLERLTDLLQSTETPFEDQALIAALLSLEGDEQFPQLTLTPQQRRQRTLDALVGAFVVATTIWARESLVDCSPDARRHYRRALGRGILIGLEVLVAATILETITLQPTLESMGLLVAMVIIRTVIGWTTSLEINGRWPWQKR